MPTTKAVLVIPEDGIYLAIRLPRILRQAGFAVDLLCRQGSPLARSRYVRQAHSLSTWEELAARLVEILRDHHRPWAQVVIAHEPTLRRVVERLDPASLATWQPGALDPLTRDFLCSKFALESARVQWGLPIPHGRTCHSAAAGNRPIIIKPGQQTGGVGVRKFDDASAVEAAAAKLAFPCVAQHYIQGRRGVVDLLCSQGRLLAWLASYSIQRTGGEFSASTARLFRPMPALLPLAQRVAAVTRFEGFCGFDWIEESSTGRHYMIEFNPRPESGFRFGRYCGVDFSAAAHAWLTGAVDHLLPASQTPGTEIPVHYFVHDLIRCVRRRDWAGLKNWLPGARSRHDIFWDDLPVLFSWIGSRLSPSRQPPVVRPLLAPVENYTVI